jgi:DNA adenine methylase
MGRPGLTAVTLQITDGQIKLKCGEKQSNTTITVELVKPVTHPIVKWAGGKQWLASAAPLIAPAGWAKRYFEPFLGGGAFFFSLEPGRATLSDYNKDLIDTYRVVRDNPANLIRLLRSYIYDEKFYYEMRSKKPRTSFTSAARFLYLNRTCWNGLYRTNTRGEFNTPFGKFINPTICDSPRLLAASRLLKRVQLRAGDFQKVVASATEGDFVYFDPPYITGHTNNGFLKYNAQLFSWSDQQRLSQCVSDLRKRGVHVLISNADHPSVLGLFKGMFFYRISRLSLIGGDMRCRKPINEALLASYPILGRRSEVL